MIMRAGKKKCNMLKSLHKGITLVLVIYFQTMCTSLIIHLVLAVYTFCVSCSLCMAYYCIHFMGQKKNTCLNKCT